MTSRKLTRTAALLAGTTALAGTAVSAADCPAGFPEKPVEFVVGYSAGGGTDAIARSVATEIEKAQGWTVVVSNRPGAGGNVMMTALKGTAPDGYTIGVGSTNSLTVDPYTSDGIDFTYEDFDYPATAMEVIFGLVALSDRPYKDLEEFVAYAKENGRATISTTAIHIEKLVNGIAEHYGVNIIPIPGGGAADALQSALGGHVDATIQGTQHIKQIQAGNMVQLATLTDERVPYAPDVKTLPEYGLDMVAGAYTLYVLPKGVDPAVKTCIEQVLDEALNSEGYGQLMTNFDNVAKNLGPDGSLEYIRKGAEYYQKVFAE